MSLCLPRKRHILVEPRTYMLCLYIDLRRSRRELRWRRLGYAMHVYRPSLWLTVNGGLEFLLSGALKGKLIETISLEACRGA